MSKNIVVLPIEQLVQFSADAISDLTYIINEGYRKQIVKYGIVVNPRIDSPDSFFIDLSLKPKTCLFYIMIDDITKIGGPLKLIQENEHHTRLYEIDSSGRYEDYRFPMENTRATVAYRPLPYSENINAYEVTAFCSFAKHAGIDIYESTKPDFGTRFPTCNELIIRVIVEHDLVSYYHDKLGFTEYNRTLIRHDKLLESGFQRTFKTNADFNIADMRQSI
ncbi:hypothetical protein C6P45_002358 [Maudiozyma exigua]|uniref:Uncharacterized protein n=1 Tax=Maudiozyma exigua TaxID=34358 RepID=A0A9P6WEW6_MAUEX|nr:hypothetical protein C6P45_002358 [Kazachstania exigua]